MWGEWHVSRPGVYTRRRLPYSRRSVFQIVIAAEAIKTMTKPNMQIPTRIYIYFIRYNFDSVGRMLMLLKPPSLKRATAIVSTSMLISSEYKALQRCLVRLGIKWSWYIVYYWTPPLNSICWIRGLLGSNSWSIEDLTKALIFVVNNQGWAIRCAILSAPIAPSMGMKSQPLH